MIPLTNKSTRVTRHLANAIDHIITISVTGHNVCRTAIIKINLSYHFTIVFALKINETTQKPVVKFTYKLSFCEKILANLKVLWTTEIGMDEIHKIQDSYKAYKYFLDIFIHIYDKSIPKSEVKVEFKKDQSPWITKDDAK